MLFAGISCSHRGLPNSCRSLILKQRASQLFKHTKCFFIPNFKPVHCHGIRVQNSSFQIRFVKKIRPPEISVFLHCGRNFCSLATRLHAGGAGRCLYRPLVGISERDHRYDDYLNSQECLINEEAAVFLRRYKLLMRADMGKRDTSNRICIVLS
jgi:hypothetical protein